MTTLYSTGCPRCKVLAKKLDAAGIPYVVVTDMDKILKACQEVGTDMVPILAVEEPGEGKVLMKFSFMSFENAIKWINDKVGDSNA